MNLREYRKEDSAVICRWICDEKALYQWSADRICKFPLEENDLNDYYAPFLPDGLIPLTAVDEDDRVTGHLFIRYPDAADRETVRFGFVIVDPAKRGCGQGKALLELAIRYAKDRLKASKITLGVFLNNDRARYCYEATGFRRTGNIVRYPMPDGEWECIEMEMLLTETA